MGLLVLILIATLAILINYKLSSTLLRSYVIWPWVLLIYWIVNIIISLLAFPNYIWNYYGSIWIMFACIAFSVGYYQVLNKKSNLENYINIDISISKRYIKNSNMFIIICLVISILYVMLLMSKYGINLLSLFDINSLIEINKTTSYIRYNGKESYSLILQLLLVFVYASTIIGGFSYIYATDLYSKVLSFFSLVPPLVILLVENTKAVMLGSLLFWISGWLIAYLSKYKSYPHFNTNKVVKVLFGILIFFAILFLSMMLRVGKFDLLTFITIKNKFINYGFGNMAAFDSWFGSIPNNSSYTFGRYTFFGIFNFLGVSDRLQGVYQDIVESGIIKTNIYTANRGIISDFGMIGGILFYTLIGALTAKAHKVIISDISYNSIYITILVMIASFIGFSALVSIFTYLSFTLAFLVFFLYIEFVKLAFKKNG